MPLSDERYLLFTTFRRDGTPVATPVWVIELDDTALGFCTSSGSGKVKRLAHTARVTVQPCDGRGRATQGTVASETTARMASNSEYELIRKRIAAKYGVRVKATRALATVAGVLRGKRTAYGDRAIVVSWPAVP
jgi:PPOX class probable F420-dependent enzyme